MPRNIQPDIERVHRRLSGVLEECTPGDRLPSYGRLMARCRCSRRVLERALELLRSEELIRIEPQKGIFVRKRPEPDERRIVIVHTDWASEYCRRWMRNSNRHLPPIPAIVCRGCSSLPAPG